MTTRVALFLGLLICVVACKENVMTEISPVPTNPFDSLNHGDTTVTPVAVDSNTFLGIHRYILSPRCAQPACHDGTFEPDYRTVFGAYNTLVYAPVVKNNAAHTFQYRVVPFDTAASWLHERITTDDPVLGRMPLYDSLPPQQIKMINAWIAAGAKDVFGNTPGLADPRPSVFALAAFRESDNLRLDTVRPGYTLNPFVAPVDASIKIWFGLYDRVSFSTGPFTIQDYNMTMALLTNGLNKVKFSTDPLHFDDVPFVDLSFASPPLSVPAAGGGSQDFYLYATVNTAQYNSGDLVYMRVYAKDADHNDYTEIPSGASPFYLKTFFAFTVQ